MGNSWFTRMFDGAPEGASEKLLAAAEGGDAQAQFRMGLSFSNRPGKSPDHKQAAAWYQKAASQSHAGAQFALGVMFSNGLGVPRDEAISLMWFGKAAERGNPDAQHAMGLHCRRAGFNGSPVDVAESLVEAYKWFRLAAEKGCKGSEAESESLAVKMTQEQVAEGDRRVAEFLASGPNKDR